MPSFNVDIDLNELLEEISDNDLIEEMESRGLCGGISDKRETLNFLKTCANFLRDHNNPAMALGMDDLISELDL